MKMGSKWVWVLGVVFIFVSLEGCLSQIYQDGCGFWEEERDALLQLKLFFNRTRYWVEGSNVIPAVSCDASTAGRVSRLILQDSRDLELREWYLNASLFSAFEELRELDLSNNSIAGFVENKGLDKLLRLSNLENLDLSYNMFNNSIFSSLGALSSLNTLYLNDNGLKGVVNVSGLDSLYNLESLDMSNNEIGKLIFPKGLRGLKYLYLQNVGIHNGSSLLQSLVSIPTLETLDLSYTNFSEMTTTQDYLHNFTNLKELQLDDSSLHISFLQSIGAFTSLEQFSMRSCQVNGILDFQGSDWLSRLSNLEYLDLSDNMFNNSILSSISALSSLKRLDLSGNRLNGIVDVGDCLNNLEDMDMSNNEIDKFIFRKGLKKLDYLKLQNVSILDGISSVLHSLSSLSSLTTLDLSFNNFNESTTTQDVSLRHSIGAFISLESLLMQNCKLYGNTSFQDLLNFTNLGDLDMDNSTLDISFFQIGMMASLESLSLRNCELQGSLSNQDLPNLKNLKYLYMDNTSLDISFLRMIGLMTSLQSISLSGCGLQSSLLHQG